MEEDKASNPLLHNFDLPSFHSISPSHVKPAIKTLLEECELAVQKIESEPHESWEGLIRPIEDIHRKIAACWGPVMHLAHVKNSPELREAFNDVLPMIVSFGLRFSQSAPIYEALRHLQDSQEWEHLTPAQKRIIKKMLDEAVHSGIELEGQARDRFNSISQELSELSTQFSNNVLDATKAFSLKIEDRADLQGVPEAFLELWANNSNAQTDSTDRKEATTATGPWTITLDYASLDPFLRYCPNRKLREEVYRAHVTKASQSPHDNTGLIDQILRLRQEKASLLGFGTYAELSLASKMADSVEAVDELLEELRQSAFAKAEKELDELQAFAGREGLREAFANWDQHFYSEKLKLQQFDLSDELLRPYFPLPKVLKGLFQLVHRLFGVQIAERQQAVEVWHPDVRFYDIFDEHETIIAGFYLDPYSRPENKRGGAWMDTCIDRGQFQGKIYLPVAYLVCNATPPSQEKPALLSFSEVETLFHEFGHGLQHMLTQVNESSAAGINGIEWDAVELPSQFMENWCYHQPTLQGMTEHIETGESLSDELFQKIIRARNFQSALAMSRQLHFGMIDLELHHRYNPSDKSQVSVFDLNQKIALHTNPVRPIEEDRFLCSFGHIFAGGYAAGYYSYKWAEVLSSDAFSRFEEEGLDNESQVEKIGLEFRHSVLALGGSQHPMEVFVKFRGRKPSVQPLLRHSGISEENSP